ncbi:YidH family protein [Ectobacillus funiculus]|uniref:YidH family protein n=1 Tax=Ectobacillus funiculus TaxID=137993 RepID=A0ABV5WIE9_9BACI
MEQPNTKVKLFPETIDSKYIQQHLANERTYLAWIRTAITICGLGFLVSNLHFAMRKELTTLYNEVATGIGLGAVLLGIIIIVLATINYLDKRKGINSQTFRASGTLIIWVSVFVVLAVIMIAFYFILLV